jgi:hypothetical protein
MSSAPRLLAASAHYRISASYESVELTGSDGLAVVIGDFYGDPEVAIIDENERWVAMGGSGLIVYFLDPPFVPYDYETATTQWVEIGRQPPDIAWMTGLRQSGEFTVAADLDGGEHRTVRFDRRDVPPLMT